MITNAIRDEGTSYHYLPPGEPARLRADLERLLAHLDPPGIQLRAGTSWTTDAPFRETQNDIDRNTDDGLAAVEMEAASLYAFATATRHDVVCFAHVTNPRASIDHDFEKGDHNGAADAHTIPTAQRPQHAPRPEELC